MKSCTLAELAETIDAIVHGDPNCIVNDIQPLETALPGALSFISNRRYTRLLKSTRASAVILSSDNLADSPCHALVMDNPYLGYAKAARFMNKASSVTPGIHPAAYVQPTASIESSACVGANSVIGKHSIVGADSCIGPGSIIGDDVVIGKDTKLVANVTICDGIHIGDRVLIYPGAVIGADGFGFAEQSDGTWLKIPQLGTVIIKNDVEIGANTTIDRGALGDTFIDEGVKIDNQVQIAHNVVIGAHTAIAGCVGIAGSVRIGCYCRIGGGCGISGHLEIADRVVVTAMSGVSNSIRQSGIYSSPLSVTDNDTWRKNVARFHHLDQTLRDIRKEIRLLKDKHADPDRPE
jgi:UDP-3-O-[3-hydroxymyristoyl] glucosamine N-acyltransferase